MDEQQIEKIGYVSKGAWSLIHRGEILDTVAEHYGRNPETTCLKIFYKNPLGNSINRYKWGGGWGFPIKDCSRMQNIASFENLAPRVYGIDTMYLCDTPYVIRLSDFVEGDKGGGDAGRLIDALKDFGVKVHNLRDFTEENFINGKFVDFQIFGVNEKVYRNKIIEILKDNVWGFLYQNVPQLGLTPHRDCNLRVKSLGLDKLDFKGKTVLDIGCSNGMFCNYAFDRGAKRVVGLDFPNVAYAAKHLSNYLCKFNIDYHGCNLKDETYESLRQKIGIDKFDIVFLLSMSVHIGSPDFIQRFCNDCMIFEKSGGNIGHDVELGIEELFKHFNSIEELPNSPDEDRKCYILKK